MYSTCLFCNKNLGTNEVVENFPIGRRLAYDEAKGRLWVVCRHCEKWNLTPLEERWEAIEECERQFRETRLRMSSDNIGLAKLKEGLTLVRIGEPMRPEFAAWRYGDQFGRRRKRTILISGLGVAAAGAVVVGGIAAGVGVAGIHMIPQMIINLPVRVKIKTKDGRILKVRNENLQRSRFLLESATDGEGWGVYVKHSSGEDTFYGEEAVRVTSLLLPKLNAMAGPKHVVQDAVERIEEAGNPERFLATLPDKVRAADSKRYGDRAVKEKKLGLVGKLPKPTKLALEMAVHEEQERRALEGELWLLEAAWREAEEIAGISDDLFVSESTEEFIERHRADDNLTTH
jgi:hypothetical protein